MAKRVRYDIEPRGSDWAVQKEGSQRASNVFENKADAIKRGTELAKAQELGQLRIKKADGTIQTEYTYGQDPRRFPS